MALHWWLSGNSRTFNWLVSTEEAYLVVERQCPLYENTCIPAGGAELTLVAQMHERTILKGFTNGFTRRCIARDLQNNISK
jgi:hypothetical protein